MGIPTPEHEGRDIFQEMAEYLNNLISNADTWYDSSCANLDGTVVKHRVGLLRRSLNATIKSGKFEEYRYKESVKIIYGWHQGGSTEVLREVDSLKAGLNLRVS